jgi:hypothetical protein
MTALGHLVITADGVPERMEPTEDPRDAGP